MYESTPAKRRTMDLTLCLKCQTPTDTKQEKLVEGNFEKIEHFLKCVKKRAELGNPVYVCLNRSLTGYSADDLLAKKACYHVKCFKLATHKQQIDREEQAKARAVIVSANPVPVSKTRSSTRTDDDNYESTKCFYCQGDQFDNHGKVLPVHAVQSGDVLFSIINVVENSENPKWKRHLTTALSDPDAVALVYHKNHHLKHWQACKPTRHN